MKSAIIWGLGMLYLIIAIIVVMALVADGKPVIAAIIAGLLWGPVLIYGILTNRF